MLAGTTSSRAEDKVTVFAAASLKNALDAVNAACEAEVGEQAHDLDRRAAHLEQALRLLLVLVDRQPCAQLGLDLGVVGQGVGIGGAELFRRLALGETEVADAVLGHHARGERGDLAPQAAAAGNVGV